MTDVTRVLLQQVEQDPLKRRRIGAVPPLARLADLIQVMGLHDGPGPRGLGVQGRDQPGECLLRSDVPAVIAAVTPGIGDIAAFEALFEPPHLHEGEVLEQPERCPAGRQPAAAQFAAGQAL